MRFTNTNWNLYRSFVTVYETKNLQRAADILDVSRSAVFQNIRELGRQLNIKLFTPHRLGVEPTSESDQLYKDIMPAIEKLCLGERNLSEFNEKSFGIIRIACTTNFSSYFLAGAIRRFYEKFPNVRFEIIVRPTTEAVKLLKNREIDCILSSLPFEKSDNLDTITLATCSSTFFANTKFAKKYEITPIISMEKFNTLPFIEVKDFFKHPRTIATTESFSSAYLLVGENLGASWCIEQFLDIHPNDWVTRFRVENIEPEQYTMTCAYLKKLATKATLTFLAGVTNPGK